jgi:hypothetical protein
MEGREIVAWFLAGVDNAQGDDGGLFLAVVETFHSGELHRLALR